MKSWKWKFLEKALLSQKVDIDNSEIVIEKCISLAYLDMLSVGRYYLSQDPEQSRKKEFKIILEQHYYQFPRTIIKDSCNIFGKFEIIGAKNNYVTRFGLAQKLVNMTYKYFYIFSDYINKDIDFTNCDCPLDSIILNKLQIKEPWSKLSCEKYLNYQNNIAEQLKFINLDNELKQISNLAFDFLNW